ncbi:Carboxylesterase CarE-11, partial [Operophtera brumata]
CLGDRIVTTSVGSIQGDLDSDGGYYKFLGIPYGHDAVPYPQFDGIYQANNDTDICPQDQGGEAVGVLDCLNLHVYVPASATATSRLPVMIWIHGGYFMKGFASENSYGPKYLVRHDVIVVAVNYRLGPYGFMCLGIDLVPGNQGLKDQQLAFEWVEKHIEAFGGNPDSITLVGQSAGAHSIDLHLLSQRSIPYHKVIIQSGSSLSRTVLQEPDRDAAIKIAELLRLDPSNSRNAVSLLAEIDAHSVIRAATELNMEFKPCVETEFQEVNPFITRSWISGAVPKVKDIPILIGFNEYERMVSHFNQAPEYFQNLDIFYRSLNQTFDFNDTRIVDDDRIERMEAYMRRFYLGDSTVSQDVVWPIINFDSDYVYNHPIQRSIQKFLDSSAGDIYYYMFAYSGGRNYLKIQYNVTAEGAAHADELGYLFDMSYLSQQISSEDQLIVDRMTTMWTNFAKYGDPTPQASDLLPVEWTPLTNEIYHYLKIDSELSMERRPFNRRMAFFDLFYNYNNEGVRSSDGDTNMFMGIPYASVNESNPFGASIPHPGFNSVFEANDDSSTCPQIEEFNHTLVGDLDCLRLNIYTPSSISTSSRLPVFVWIYGGGFQIGFYGKFMYGPKFLVRHDVILVTINYRLGPYGFMCLDIPEVPGNQGLKDTVLALRWVQSHIESFGGDPNKITIGGNSAGAMAVDYHMIRKPNGETLFHNAILQSGTTLLPFFGEPETNYAVIIANHLGYETDDVYAALSFLATVPPLDMIGLTSSLGIDTTPCVEKEFEGVESFLTERVSTAVHHVENVSIMIGITDDEAYSLSATGLNDPSTTDVVLSMLFDTQHENFTGASAVRSFYFGDQELGEGTLRGTIDLFSDFLFVYPPLRSTEKFLDNNVKSLYFFMFAHDGGRNFVKYRENLVGGGATHADELGYLFDMEFMPEEPTLEDQLVIDKMTAMWANFIKYGDPTPQTTELLDVKWEPVTKTSPLYCMVIAKELSLITRPFYDRMAFMDLFYFFVYVDCKMIN